MVAIMIKLLRQQAAPDVDINIFTSDPVDCHYFIAGFDKMVKKKIDDPDKIHKIYPATRISNHYIRQPVCFGDITSNHYIQQPVGYKNERSLLEEMYGDPHQIVAAYHKEIKSWDNLKTSR